MTTVRELLVVELARRGELWSSIERVSFAPNPWATDQPDPSDTEKCLDHRFPQKIGGTSQMCFTAWTGTRVYFPVEHDGLTWVESVPRDPCAEATCPLGGTP